MVEVPGNAAPSEPILVSAVESPFGAFFIATRSGAAIASAGPRHGPSDPLAWGRWSWPTEVVRLAGRRHALFRAELRSYFAGAIRTLSIPVTLAGRPSDVAAWQAAREIPYGKTLTYGELALEIGRPGTARAVGRAMSVCALPLLVPCHRVIGAGGRRCGGPEGWMLRETLLAFERSFLEPAGPGPAAEHRRRGRTPPSAADVANAPGVQGRARGE